MINCHNIAKCLKCLLQVYDLHVQNYKQRPKQSQITLQPLYVVLLLLWCEHRLPTSKCNTVNRITNAIPNLPRQLWEWAKVKMGKWMHIFNPKNTTYHSLWTRWINHVITTGANNITKPCHRIGAYYSNHQKCTWSFTNNMPLVTPSSHPVTDSWNLDSDTGHTSGSDTRHTVGSYTGSTSGSDRRHTSRFRYSAYIRFRYRACSRLETQTTYS